MLFQIKQFFFISVPSMDGPQVQVLSMDIFLGPVGLWKETLAV